MASRPRGRQAADRRRLITRRRADPSLPPRPITVPPSPPPPPSPRGGGADGRTDGRRDRGEGRRGEGRGGEGRQVRQVARRRSGEGQERTNTSGEAPGSIPRAVKVQRGVCVGGGGDTWECADDETYIFSYKYTSTEKMPVMFLTNCIRH